MNDQANLIVTITVICGAGHVVGTYHNKIAEKYPFFCETCEDEHGCGDLREGKYPWSLSTAIQVKS